MKHVFSVLSVACVAFFTILLSSTSTGCKKGDDGAKGDTGTANVIYSPWLDVNYDAVTNTAGDTVYYYQATIAAPKLTKAIIDSGTVKVYLNLGSAASPEVWPLPITDLFQFTGITELGLYYTVGNINLFCDLDASTFTSSGTKHAQYRYILIPGGVPTGRSAVVDWNNYEAVKRQFNLTD
ncbi:hypothetical protein [Longitalea arenae]|uniref:hypothetical protein n=1 Tax=Longitalea arenae TaxID=2812558 RepID=UPI001968215C|nr:hypothetical protein [Longitalea arenae]